MFISFFFEILLSNQNSPKLEAVSMVTHLGLCYLPFP